jgi:hypothetical protein
VKANRTPAGSFSVKRKVVPTGSRRRREIRGSPAPLIHLRAVCDTWVRVGFGSLTARVPLAVAPGPPLHEAVCPVKTKAVEQPSLSVRVSEG